MQPTKGGGTVAGTNVTIRMPDELHRWLVKLAERERRSISAQVIVILERERDRGDQE